MQSKTLIVVGMHRSGTSLITNWLYRCGLQVGECLLGADLGNAEGHFEDVEFLRLHEEVLASNDLPPTGLIYDKAIVISEYQLEKLKTVIKIKNHRYKQWGWKEPRTCLFLDLYRELLPNSKYLVIARDYQSVVNSLLKRDFDEVEKKYLSRKLFSRMVWIYLRKSKRKRLFYHKKAEYYLNVWIDYNEHILSMLKELSSEDYIVIHYSLLGEHDRQVFSFLTNTWRFALKYFSFKEVYKENLISRPFEIKSYISNNALLSKAKGVEDALNAYVKAY